MLKGDDLVNYAWVRYGDMRLSGYFKIPEGVFLKVNDRCVVQTDRGTEFGEVVALFEQLPADVKQEDVACVIRKATSEDNASLKTLREQNEVEEFDFCKAKIAELNLPMKLVWVEHLFGGEKVVFYFVADGRVDFRALVRELAKKYRTRIEMRQIGVRDEAKLLGDFEHCGRELCCRTFLAELQPVTMQMAKDQKTTLDPTRISGYCGRLMCCLRYEEEIYAESLKRLPKRGTKVRTSVGIGEVVDEDVLAETITLEMEDGTRVRVHYTEVLERI